ncbi:hypothetical protein BH11PSE11_BH11PSE11_38650 [soil metagenome]
MTRLQIFLIGKKNQIGRRLIILIIAFSSVITLLLSAVELVTEYRSLRTELDRQLEQITIYVPSLSGSVWDFDEKQIQLTIDALELLPNIELVKVATANDRKQWTAGKGTAKSTLKKTYQLRHEVRGKDTEIGRLEVVASLSAIYQQLVSRALSIIFNNGLKTFLVAIFMGIMFRRMVTRRLETLAIKIEMLAPELQDAQPFGDSEPHVMPPHMDELDAVNWTLDNAATKLAMAVDAMHDLNHELRQRVAVQEALLQNALVGIVMLRDRKIVTCNPRFEEIFGYGPDEMNGLSTRVLYLNDEDYESLGEQSYGTLRKGLSYRTSILMAKRDGSQFWGEITGCAIDPSRPMESSIWIYTDVTDRKLAEQKIEFIAYHDTLTGLPNRLLAQDRLQQAMTHADRTRSRIAFLFLDLDNFKTINDSLGHAVGDMLIKQVAVRLTECVRESDIVSRQGGDEFLIVLPEIPGPDAIAQIMVPLMERLVEPFEIDGQELHTSISLGVSIYPEDGADFETLLKKADMAMYRAKDAGRNTYRFFDEQMNVEAVDHLSMRNGLRRALERNEFVLHYQPQLDLTTGAMIGAEALIRWNHPELGMVPPARFIPIAEDSGLIVPIGEWVLREACRQSAVWRKAGVKDLVVAVNLSAIQFRRGDLEQSLVGALEESGIDPGCIELELTESILISDTESVLATVKRLKVLGVKLSIDDFGTGYSSLSYLKRFQVDKLKIDQSFVRGLATNPEDAAIIRAIIQMAHGLGLTTIAEGVEDEQALAQLRAFGCDEAQGYFFARPMPATELLNYIETSRADGKLST